jgi:hypothetical protein
MSLQMALDRQAKSEILNIKKLDSLNEHSGQITLMERDEAIMFKYSNKDLLFHYKSIILILFYSHHC